MDAFNHHFLEDINEYDLGGSLASQQPPDWLTRRSPRSNKTLANVFLYDLLP